MKLIHKVFFTAILGGFGWLLVAILLNAGTVPEWAYMFPALGLLVCFCGAIVTGILIVWRD